VKTPLYLGKYCENNVQLQWRGERVAFIKGWSEFVGKVGMVVDGMILFTHMDAASTSRCTGTTPPWRSSRATRSISRVLGKILGMNVVIRRSRHCYMSASVQAFVMLWL
jgi:hypothetical protein